MYMQLSMERFYSISRWCYLVQAKQTCDQVNSTKMRLWLKYTITLRITSAGLWQGSAVKKLFSIEVKCIMILLSR